MPTLTPVEGNPFKLTPVEGNPFGEKTKREVLQEAFKARREGKAGALDTFEARPRDTTAYDPNEGVGSRVFRAAKNLPGSAARLADAFAGGTVGALPTVANVVAHPVKSLTALGQTALDAGEIAAQGLDRNLIHTGKDTSKYDEFADANWQKYGTVDRVAHTLAADPALPALVAVQGARAGFKALPAGVKAPITRGTRAVTALPGRAVSPVVNQLKDFTGAERRGKAAAATMGEAENTYLSGVAADTEGELAANLAKADRARALAARARKSGNEAFARRMDAVAEANAPPVAVGQGGFDTDIGAGLREPALKAQATHEATMQAGYAKQKEVTQAIAKDLADKGIGASDGPKAQALIKEVTDAIEPNRYERKPVSSTLDPGREGAAHKRVLARLTDERHDVKTPKEVAEAKKFGHEILKDAEGEYYITKPDLAAIENLHRELGDKAFGREVEGWGNVNQKHAQHLYERVNEVLDEYTSGAHSDLRKTWREGKDNLQAFEKIKAGRDIVGMQPGTGTPSVPTNKIPDRMIAGGRDTLNQVQAVAGAEPVEKAVRSMLQNELAGKDAAAMQHLVGPNGKFGDALEALPGVKQDVHDLIAQTLNAERSGAAAEGFASRAKTGSSRADKLEALATRLEGSSEKLVGTRRSIERELVDLELEAPEKVGERYTKMLTKAHDEGLITQAQYKAGRELASSAATDFAKKKTRDKALKNMAFALGVAPIGYMATGPVGAMAGLGLLAAKPHVRKLLPGARRN